MCNRPDWLPDTTPISKDWIDGLYGIFTESFVENPCYFKGMLVWPIKDKIDGQREEGFWHMITREYTKDNRFVDPLRAERLVWVRPLLEHSDDPSVKTFKVLHNGKKERIYVWIESCDFLVVLEPMRNGRGVLLITAFHLDGQNERDKYNKLYDQRII